MAVACCCKGNWITGRIVATLAVREFEKEALGIVATPGNATPGRDPKFGNGRRPGAATPDEHNDSAG